MATIMDMVAITAMAVIMTGTSITNYIKEKERASRTFFFFIDNIAAYTHQAYYPSAINNAQDFESR